MDLIEQMRAMFKDTLETPEERWARKVDVEFKL